MADPRRWIATLLFLATHTTAGASNVSICYFTSWSTQRPNPHARLSIENKDSNLCTHLVYAFAKIDLSGKTIVAAEPVREYDQGGTPGLYSYFNQLKEDNPNLKTLLSVGGEGGAVPFIQVSSSSSSISEFSRNAAFFLRSHGFDGLDVDWEFPDETTKSQFSSLLKGLRGEFSQNLLDGKPLLLTAAVAAGETRIRAGYNIAEVSKYLDYIMIMAYDFFGTWSRVTGFNSPLLARNDSRFSTLYNVEHAVSVWIDGGAERSKVVLGMTGAGASFILANSTDHGVGALVDIGGGDPGDLYGLKGRLIYPEICKKLSEGWSRVWDEAQQVPYAFSGVNWVGYDDQQSIKLKVSYAIKHKLGGVMFWELSFDDPQNICGAGQFPLLNVVKDTLGFGSSTTSKGTSDQTTSKGTSDLGSLDTTTLPSTSQGSSNVSICYFTSWSTQRPNPSARLSIENIDYDLCTHLVYAFAKIDRSGKTIVAAEPAREYDQGGTPGLYSLFNQLKEQNPNLKTLLSVGGEGGAAPFIQVSSSSSSISEFSRNAASFLRSHGFDGLDVDWEFPDETTKSQFSSLLKSLRQEFSRNRDGKPLLLTAAVSAGDPVIKAGYNIIEVSRYLDYILIMAYDFFGTWSQVTGFNSPLLARNDPQFSPLYNVDHAVNVWIDGGAERSKIVLGITGAGASFTLSNTTEYGVGAPVDIGGGAPGDLFGYQGRLIYPEICEKLSEGWNRVWDEDQQVPYAFSGVNWVGYDDQQSIRLKVSYAIKHKLGGVMFWELSFDDPQSICGAGQFPLLNVVKDTLGFSTSTTSKGTLDQTTPKGTSDLGSLDTTTLPSTSQGSSNVSICYFTSWSTQRPNPRARLSIENTDYDLCTHLVYAFAKIDLSGKTIVAAEPAREYDQGGTPGLYSLFNQLKEKNPNLKTLLSVGGEGGAVPFVQISSSASSISEFSSNAASFLRSHGFDGLDVDWEFPDETTKSQFSSLLKSLRQEFSRNRDGKPLLLTAAVSAGDPVIKAGYNIIEVSRYLDYILIMAYDFFGTWSQVTGFNSPLLARNDPQFSPLYNVDHAVNVWIDGGAERSKIVLGITGAGASFTLSNTTEYGVGAPVDIGGGAPGDLFGYQGRLIYPEICEKLSEGWNRVWDEDQQVPYAFSGVNWVGYDDQQSIRLKVSYAIKHKLGGVMFWELSFDDPRNICGAGQFPLLNVVRDTLGFSISTTSLRTTDHTSSETTTTDGTSVNLASTGTSDILLLCLCGLSLLVISMGTTYNS